MQIKFESMQARQVVSSRLRRSFVRLPRSKRRLGASLALSSHAIDDGSFAIYMCVLQNAKNAPVLENILRERETNNNIIQAINNSSTTKPVCMDLGICVTLYTCRFYFILEVSFRWSCSRNCSYMYSYHKGNLT